MKAGAVIVDMAASTGGNCELTENGKTTHPHGVTLIGDSNLAGSVSKDASVMFGKNIVNFLKLLMIKNELTLNWEDDIIAATCVAHEGKVISERVKGAMG
jgi:NAD(P) transhydrogenase subunit alpha